VEVRQVLAAAEATENPLEAARVPAARAAVVAAALVGAAVEAPVAAPQEETAQNLTRRMGVVVAEAAVEALERQMAGTEGSMEEELVVQAARVRRD